MSTRPVISYVQSFLLITLLIVVAEAVRFNVEMLFVDFIHGNPHRPQSNALFMMATYTPIFAVLNTIICFLVLALPQYLQAEMIQLLQSRYGDKARFVVFPTLPATALLTWYGYDYLTPHNLSLGGSDLPLYEHGISVARYGTALAVQAPITLFNFLYFSTGLRGASRWPLIVAALAISVATGGFLGYVSARTQYQFLQ